MAKQKYYKEQKKKYYEKHKERILADAKVRYHCNKEKFRLNARKRRLRAAYFTQLTTEEAYNTYLQMLKDQDNKCAICGNYETKIDPQLKTPYMLAVDHCHATGKVRGLLCFRCNTNLGWFESMQDKFTKYLEENNG